MEQQVVAGRYQVVREIARGGMGSVHEAVHVVSKKRVALKLLFPTFAKDEASRQRFLREASAPAQIGHEGIVEVYDAGVDTDGTLFVAMELLEGGTVRDRLERGNITLPEFFSIFLRTLEPLSAAHQRGIIHRDLKPENVFLVKKPNGSEVLKILDFGIARDLEAQQQSMTQTGTAMGTPHYMAPEQAMSARGVVATADVWAIGAMMYEVVTGSVPFEGETASAVIVHVCVQPLRSLAEVAPGVPPALAALIERCLSKEPAGRPRDAAALLAELQAVANQLGVQVPASTTFATGAQGGHPSHGAHPSQVAHPSQGAHPSQAGQGGVSQPTGAPAGFGSSPGYATGPGMAGASTHQSHPSSPGMQGAGQPGHPGQHGYPGQQAYPSQGGYPAQAPSHPGMPGVGMPQQGYPSNQGMQGGGPSGQYQQPQGGYPPPGQFGTYAAAPTYTEPAKASNRGLVIGLVSGLAILGVGVGAYFAFGRSSPEATASSVTPAVGVPTGAVDPAAVPVAVPSVPVVPAVPPTAGAAAAGAAGFTEPTGPGARRFTGGLATGDRTLQSGEFADSYQVTLAVGQRFRARVHAEKFDPYIIVRAPSGTSQDNDDANAQTHDSELVLTATEAGTWTFIATSFQPGESGDYELSVETLP